MKRSFSGRLLSAGLAVCLALSAVTPAGAISQGPGGTADAPRTAPRYRDLTPGLAGEGTKTKQTRALNVQLRPGVPAEQLAAAGARLGFKVVRRSEKLGWVQLMPNTRVAPGSIATRLREAGLVRDVRQAVTYTAAAVTPNDPRFGEQWSLENTGQNGGTPDADIDAPELWEQTRGDQGTVVAVIDTGVYWQHPDLKPNMWVNPGEVPGNDIDDDDNGYVDDVRGYDFYNYDGSVYDAYDGDQHGTHVAGIIAAAADNGIGIAGVTDATIMPLKFLGPWGGDDYSAAEAIFYAVDNGADVINCSWGGGGESEVLDEAIAYANQAGVLMVCAAGNWGENTDEWINYPSGSPSPNIISVAATDRDDELAYYSNYGVNTVDIAAPGSDVLATLPWETNGLFIDRLPYKICYQPLQLEVLEPAAQRDGFIVRSVQQVGAKPDTPILVVDDSASKLTSETAGERLGIYTNALAAAGFTDVATWVTEAKGAPTYSAMRGRVVVWFTGRASGGWYDELTFTEKDIAALSTYLDNGGRLVMASGELATEMLYFGVDPEFFYTYFGAEIYDLLSWSDFVRGVPSGRFGGLAASIPSVYQTDDYFWPTGSDLIVPLDPEDTTVRPLSQMGGYGMLSGTSMAAPHVTGAAALLKSAFPNADAGELSARICNGGDDLPSLASKVGFETRLNVVGATAAYTGRPTVSAPKAGTKLPAGTTATVSWTPAAGGTVTGYEVEFGTPVTTWTNDFNSGVLGDFVKPDFAETGFEITGLPQWVYEGGFAALSTPSGPSKDLGDGWVQGTQSAVTTTITVPPGGGTMSLWWNYRTTSWNNVADIFVDQTEVTYLWGESTDGFKRVEFSVPSGEHTVTVRSIEFEKRPPIAEEGLAFDDARLITHEFQPVATAPAGATEVSFTVPAVATDNAWLRVRATGAEKPSPWAYVRGLQVTDDAVAPSAPSGLSLTPDTNGFAAAAWTNPADADYDYTKVLWRIDRFPTGPSDPHATVALEGTSTAVTVGPAPNGRTIYLAAYAADTAGNWSQAATATAVVSDTQGPAAVGLLTAEYYDGAATVSWMPPDVSDYSSVTVLRRTDTTPTVADPAAVKVFTGTGSMASDWMLDPKTPSAYYTVYATDASRNRSEPRSVRLDAGGGAPQGTMDLAGGAYFVDKTEIAVASDVTGATEMRFLVDDVDPLEVMWEPFSAQSVVTIDPVDGVHTVVAEYRGDSGAVLRVTDEVFLDLLAPKAPDAPFVDSYNTGLAVTWDAPADGSVLGYAVYRALGPLGPWTDITPDDGMAPEGYRDFVDVGAGGFFDGDVTPGRGYYYALVAVDSMGRTSPRGSAGWGSAQYGVTRVAGATTYATGAAMVRRHFSRAGTVVLVSGTAWADALGASALAGCLSAPMLMTDAGSLDAHAAAEIKRLQAKKVIIVGGVRSVGKAVADKLAADGLTVERIAGRDRYETASKVALRVTAESDEWSGRVIVVNGTAPADAMALGPYAWATETPILLVTSTGVPSGTRQFYGDRESLGDLDHLVVGGPVSVPERVVASITDRWMRIGGKSRYHVAVNVAEFAAKEGALDWQLVGVANGMRTAEALVAGPVLGKQGGMLLLSAPAALSDPARAGLTRHRESVSAAEVYGPTGVLSLGVYQQTHDAMSMPSGPMAR